MPPCPSSFQPPGFLDFTSSQPVFLAAWLVIYVVLLLGFMWILRLRFINQFRYVPSGKAKIFLLRLSVLSGAFCPAGIVLAGLAIQWGDTLNSWLSSAQLAALLDCNTIVSDASDYDRATGALMTAYEQATHFAFALAILGVLLCLASGVALLYSLRGLNRLARSIEAPEGVW